MAEQQGNTNAADDLLWGVGGAIIAVGLIWYAFHVEITIALLYLADYKVRFLELFLSSPEGGYLYELRHWINNINPAQLDFGALMLLAKSVGRYFMVPVSLFMLYWAYLLYMKPTFSRKLSTESLLDSESRLWPEILPATFHNILDEDVFTGKWAASRSPVEFIEHFKLIDKEGELKRDRAEKVMVKQLGRPYKGLSSLNKYEKALVGCFCAAILDDKPTAEATLDLLNMSYDGEDINPEPGIKLLDTYYKDEKIQAIVQSHYYKNTVLYAMLVEARLGSGVLASAAFTWLKPLSRQSWYVLNNVGRKVAWSDVCAIFSHYNGEMVLNKMKQANPQQFGDKVLSKPFVIKAVNGLEKVTRERVIKLPD